MSVITPMRPLPQTEHLIRLAAREQLTAQTELLRSIDREQVRHHGHD